MTPTPTPAPTPSPAAGTSLNDLLAQIASGGGTAAANPSDPPVPSWNMLNEQRALFPGTTGSGSTAGEGFSDARDTYNASHGAKVTTDRTQSQVTADVLRMSDADLDALRQRLINAGLLPQGTTARADVEQAWGKLVQRAADWHAANPNSSLTPEDMIDIYGNSGGSKGGATTENYVTKKIQLSDPFTARALLANVLTTALGRNPTGKEQDDFQAALNAAQYANPEVTTQTIDNSPANLDPNGMGYKNTSTTVTGGVNPNDFANEYATKNVDQSAEYRNYQAATTYAPALLQAIRGPYGP